MKEVNKNTELDNTDKKLHININLKTPTIMNDIFEYKYEISVKVKHQLTDEELNMIKRDFWVRLQGYHTECPEQLIGADIEIRGKILI